MSDMDYDGMGDFSRFPTTRPINNISRRFKLLLIISISLIVVSLLSAQSHSCPEPGHGPCYLCDS